MRLSGVYPFLDAYHRAIGRSDEEIEALAERAWRDGAEPYAVLRRDDGAWVAWRALADALEPGLRAQLLRLAPYRQAAARSAFRPDGAGDGRMPR